MAQDVCVFFANALLLSIDTLRDVAPNQNQPARIRSGGCGFGAIVARVVVLEASGKQVRKQASLKARRRAWGPVWRAVPEASRKQEKDTTGS